VLGWNHVSQPSQAWQTLTPSGPYAGPLPTELLCSRRRVPPAAPLRPHAASRRSRPTCGGPGRSYRRTGLHPGRKCLNWDLIEFIPFSNLNKNRWFEALIQHRISLESLCNTFDVFPYKNTFPCNHFVHQKNRATTFTLLLPSPSWSRAARAPPLGQGGPPLPPGAASLITLARGAPEPPSPQQCYPQAEAPPRCTPSSPSVADQCELNRGLLVITKP
jgi:hypothetical protein